MTPKQDVVHKVAVFNLAEPDSAVQLASWLDRITEQVQKEAKAQDKILFTRSSAFHLSGETFVAILMFNLVSESDIRKAMLGQGGMPQGFN